MSRAPGTRSSPTQAPGQVMIREFKGFQPNADPHDLEPGVSIRQVNVSAQRPGELRVRAGFATIRYDS